VDLSAVRENVARLKRKTSSEILAVIKANGYGHGSTQVAQAAAEAGATWFGVARADEALEIRKTGLDCKILILGYTPGGRVEAMIANRIAMAAWTPEHVQKAAQVARKINLPAHLHLKIDTGMNRLGAPPEEALTLATKINQNPNLILEGVFTHFAKADEVDDSTNKAQEERFLSILVQLEAHNLKPPYLHAANSAASLTRPSAYFNLVRPGIAIYGLSPFSDSDHFPSFRPALKWKAVLSHVKMVAPEEGISYGHIYKTQKEERIGTIPVGYADGYRRVAGNQVYLHGKHVPVIGRVCMDQIMVNLDEVPEATPGDVVELIGDHITVDDVAACWKTINYEVVCGIDTRVPRIYQDTKST
jgi:alanine racemase